MLLFTCGQVSYGVYIPVVADETSIKTQQAMQKHSTKSRKNQQKQILESLGEGGDSR